MTRIIVSLIALALVAVAPATAATFRDASVALARHDYTTAANIFSLLAERGDARAQAIMGYLYATGRGVPQNYIEAARWYRRASEQGDANGQYMLGLAHDKGHGVPQDYVEAYKWLDLAVARASGRVRQDWVRIRDAVSSKLSLAQITEAQRRALQWRPVYELPAR